MDGELSELLGLPTAPSAPKYQCPGETYAISESVHLARLAAFYPKCRECTHRHQTGQLPPRTLELLRQTEHRVQRPSLFGQEGVRGVYLNELDRDRAGRLAGSLARHLWDLTPLQLRGTSDKIVPRPAPLIVIGYDERESSPDIFSGVAAMLGRMSCRVVDVSLTTRPCFDFAVRHLEAAGGVFVTGAGYGPSWTGLDFVARNGVPLSSGGGLDELKRRHDEGYSRPTRSSAPRQPFQAAVPYEAGLWKDFHALRPLKVVVGSSQRLTRERLARLFRELPCDLSVMELPVRGRTDSDTENETAELKRLADLVRRDQADLGMLIDDDDRRCILLDECGEPVASGDLTVLCGRLLLAESSGGTLAAELPSGTEGLPIIPPGKTQEELVRIMQQRDAVLGSQGDGRFWFQEMHPVCDGLITLAKVLQVLSRGDAALSELVESLSSARAA